MSDWLALRLCDWGARLDKGVWQKPPPEAGLLWYGARGRQRFTIWYSPTGGWRPARYI